MTLGGPAAYDVSVHTVFRANPRFVAACAATPGHAAAEGGKRKSKVQYKHRSPGAVLIPLTAEVGGRWAQPAVKLLRKLSREYISREPALPSSSLGPVVGRWAARLSAILIRGNAAVVRAGGGEFSPSPEVGISGSHTLAHLVPEGKCTYEHPMASWVDSELVEGCCSEY